MENSTPDALSRYLTEEVGSSPDPERDFFPGITGRALAKNNCAAGWMALAGWMYGPSTEEEAADLEDLEEEAVLACKDSLNSMGYGAEDDVGKIMAAQVQSVTWERVVDEARKCPLYQKLVWAVLSDDD